MRVDAKAAFELLVIVTPNFNLAATVGFLDPFRASNYLDGSILFRWDLALAAGGEIIASNGVSVHTRALREVRNQPQDMVIVSSSWAPETHNSAPLHSALLRWARAGVTLGAIDTGAFILAEAGLLKGKRATTHYEHIDSLRELYVDTDTSEDLFVYDGNRITCCGGTATTDFALHIIRSMHGDSLANAAACYLFHQTLRSQGTSQNEFRGAVGQYGAKRLETGDQAHGRQSGGRIDHPPDMPAHSTKKASGQPHRLIPQLGKLYLSSSVTLWLGILLVEVFGMAWMGMK